MAYCRGVDLKLGSDAHVLVVVNKSIKAITESTVKQMVGRSTRRLNMSVGTVMVSRDLIGQQGNWE